MIPGVYTWKPDATVHQDYFEGEYFDIDWPYLIDHHYVA